MLHKLPAKNGAAGGRGSIGCLPDRIADFESDADRAIEYVTALGCTRVNCLAGIKSAAAGADVAGQTFVRNLQYAAPRFEAAGIRLPVESINMRNVPGFLLSGTSQALDIIGAVGSKNLSFRSTCITCT